MKYHITVRSWWLLVACFALGAGAVWFIVLDDWRHGAELSADHGMFFLLFLSSLLSGLFIGPAVRAKKLGTAAMLFIVTCASALLLVTESAGRVAKGGLVAEALANKDGDAVKGAAASLEKARAALDLANVSLTRECSSGRGTRCQGLRETVEVSKLQFYEAQVRFDALKPAAPANGTAAYFEAVATVLGFGADGKRWGQGYTLASPVARVFTFDICILVLLHLALGVEIVKSKVEKPKDEGGDEKPRLALPAPAIVDDPVVLALRKAKKPVTNDELASMLGVSKSTASKWVSDRADLLSRHRTGREVQISLMH